MTYIKRKATPIALRNIAFGSISSTYANLGAVLSAPLEILILNNGTDATMIVSIDGANDNFKLSAGQVREIKLRKDWFFEKGLQIRIKDAGVAATSGYFCAEGIQV